VYPLFFFFNPFSLRKGKRQLPAVRHSQGRTGSFVFTVQPFPGSYVFLSKFFGYVIRFYSVNVHLFPGGRTASVIVLSIMEQ